MDTSTTRLIGPLYHGTRDTAARTILREGFRRSRSRNYTGTGICLSESLTLAYEYGMYETGGCVLEARLAPSARWTDHLAAWNEAFLRSYFTHPNGPGKLVRYRGGAYAFWREMLDGRFRRFPERVLVDVKMTLGGLLGITEGT